MRDAGGVTRHDYILARQKDCRRVSNGSARSRTTPAIVIAPGSPGSAESLIGAVWGTGRRCQRPRNQSGPLAIYMLHRSLDAPRASAPFALAGPAVGDCWALLYLRSAYAGRGTRRCQWNRTPIGLRRSKHELEPLKRR